MERIGVCVRNGIVENVIIWADHTPEQLANEGWQHMEEVTGMTPRPGIGWTWETKHGYRPPKPHPSWLWDQVRWIAPVAQPSEGGPYTWNEETQIWDQVELPA